MIIVSTRSYDHVTEIEKGLISHTIEKDGSLNQVGGGGGKQADAKTYYVYFLISEKTVKEL